MIVQMRSPSAMSLCLQSGPKEHQRSTRTVVRWRFSATLASRHLCVLLAKDFSQATGKSGPRCLRGLVSRPHTSHLPCRLWRPTTPLWGCTRITSSSTRGCCSRWTRFTLARARFSSSTSTLPSCTASTRPPPRVSFSVRTHVSASLAFPVFHLSVLRCCCTLCQTSF
jgi:hypothetical protein